MNHQSSRKRRWSTPGAGISRLLWHEVDRDGTRVLHLVQLAVFFLVVFAVTAATVVPGWTTGATSLQAGEIAGQTYKAPSTTTYVSEVRTEDLRQEAYDSVENIVKTHDETIRDRQISAAQGFLDIASDTRASDQSDAAKIAELQSALPDLEQEEAGEIVGLSDSSWEAVREEVIRLVDVTHMQQIESGEVASTIDQLPERASTLLDPTEQQLAVTIAAEFINPNVFIDDAATEATREAAADAIEPVEVTVQAGQAIVRDGAVVTETDVEALEQLGLLESQPDIAGRLGRAAMMAVLTLALGIYLYAFNKDIWRQRQLVLVAVVILIPVVVARIVLPHPEIQYMFPAAASAMLLAILVNLQFASVVAALLALYTGVATNLSFELTFIYFLGSIVGTFLIWRAERTMTFIWSGIGVALAMFAGAVAFELLEGDLTAARSAVLLIETGVAGALSAAITFLLFSVLGSIFGITTGLQLQELAHPRQPLLSRLAREAPGTYHHSIIVSNLAESAASPVGADPLFTRVAVLYHDIGKLKHPTFYIENQANIGNIHDSLDPRVSAEIIVNHVRDGIELAKKARVPKSIINVIAQHHGTSRIEYFYRKALESDPNTDPADFTYPGPKPQTKEAAVIMLADSVEAAVRSASQSGRLFGDVAESDRTTESNQLAQMVNSIVQARVDAGQFDECDLTFRDVQNIKSTFVQILEGIYHPRVEYPPSVDVEQRQLSAKPSPSGSD